jgi:metallo-beta-lactamase family protein
MSKKKSEITIQFVGENVEDVTGSCIWINTGTKQILLECGLFQGNNLKRDFEINSKPFQFKAKEIDYCFVDHGHIDHSGKLGKLIKDGFNGKIITTPITARLLYPLLQDSAYIMKKDAETLSRQKGEQVEPIYSEEDAQNVFNYIYEYGYDEIYELDEEISFKFLRNSHILGASQLELFVRGKSGHINKIFYSSDIGSQRLKKSFVDDNECCTKASVAIVESTYASSERIIKKKDRDKDIEKIKAVVENVCMEQNGRILVPCFSLDRSQYILTLLYELFGNREDFDIPIIVDSPLTYKITEIYKEILEGKDKELFDNACNWKNVRFIRESDESKACVSDRKSKIVISSSGFLMAGRSVHYLKEFLPHSKDMILFVGFATPTSLAGRIKDGVKQKTITIDGKPYKNNCQIVSLHSFSSHIQRDEMINYYKNINCEKIILVHGDKNAKLGFAKELKEELEKMNKTTKVICPTRSTVVRL